MAASVAAPSPEAAEEMSRECEVGAGALSKSPGIQATEEVGACLATAADGITTAESSISQ